MKQYRIKTSRDWSEWRKLAEPLYQIDILTIQFNEPLAVEEVKEFFKHYVDKV